MDAPSGPRLIVVCVQPGCGKRTLARQLETELRAIRFEPDEWMQALSASLWDEARPCGGHRVGHLGRSERDVPRLGTQALGAAAELPLSASLDVLFDLVQRRGLEDPPLTLEHMRRYAEILQAPMPEETALFDPPLL